MRPAADGAWRTAVARGGQSDASGFTLDQVSSSSAKRDLASSLRRPIVSISRRSIARMRIGKCRVFREHGGNCFHRAPLVDEQHEELLAHHALEFAERHAATGLFAHAAQEVEAALVENAVGLVDVQQRTDRRFARASLGNGSLQLFDPLSDQTRDGRDPCRALRELASVALSPTSACRSGDP